MTRVEEGEISKVHIASPQRIAIKCVKLKDY